MIGFHDETGGTGGQPDDRPDHSDQTQEGDIVITDLDGDTTNDTTEIATPEPNGTLKVNLIGTADESDCGIVVVFQTRTPMAS